MTTTATPTTAIEDTPVRVRRTVGVEGLTQLARRQEVQLLTTWARGLFHPTQNADVSVIIRRTARNTRVTVELWQGARRSFASLTVPNSDLDQAPEHRAMILTTAVSHLTKAIKATLPIDRPTAARRPTRKP